MTGDDEEPDMFEAYARRTDPQTSHAAADSLSDETLSRMESIAYAAVVSQGERGLINQELVDLTGMPWQSITPRMKPLERKGLVFRRLNPETGEYQTRESKVSGKQQDIFFLSKEPTR